MDQVTAIGRLLASDRGAWSKLLAQHVADDSGHCAGCRSAALAPPVWPCRLRGIAEEARRAASEL